MRCFRKAEDVVFCVGAPIENPSHEPGPGDPEVPFIDEAMREVMRAAHRVFAANVRKSRIYDMFDIRIWRDDELPRNLLGRVVASTASSFAHIVRGGAYNARVDSIDVMMEGRPEYAIYGTLLHELAHAACILVSPDYLREAPHGFAWQSVMLEIGLPPVLIDTPFQDVVTDPNDRPDYAGRASHDDERLRQMFVNRARERVIVGDSLWALSGGRLVYGYVNRKLPAYVEFTRLPLAGHDERTPVPYEYLWFGDYEL